MAVTAGPRAVVEDFYRRSNAGERDPVLFFHPEVEWHWPRDTPGASVFHGHDGIGRGFAMWSESWGQFRMEPYEFLEEGEEVLAMVRYRLRGAESGIDIEHPVAHLMRVEGGLIRAWWMFGDPDKARRRFLAGDRPG
jgi:ketosteroid isomerase-like protein